MLGGGNDGAVFLDPPSDIQQSEQDAAWTHPHEIIVVAPLPLAVVGSSQLGVTEFRNRGLYRLWQGLGRLFVVEEEAHKSIDRRS
jgi:hypothetical protein